MLICDAFISSHPNMNTLSVYLYLLEFNISASLNGIFERDHSLE